MKIEKRFKHLHWGSSIMLWVFPLFNYSALKLGGSQLHNEWLWWTLIPLMFLTWFFLSFKLVRTTKNTNKARAKFRICFRIITGKYDNFVLVSIADRKQGLRQQILRESYGMEIEYVGLKKYNSLQLIKDASASISEEEFLLERATFQAEAEELTGLDYDSIIKPKKTDGYESN